MCAVLNISPKTYYKYRNKEDPDYYDYLIIKEIFDDSKGTYGYRRIVEGLKIKYGVIMNRKKVLRIMKKYNLMAEYVRKSKKKNKKERIEDNVKPNLLNRNFTTNEPNKIWDTDVTYLISKGSRAYLSTIIDLYDRHVVSYKISKHNDNKLVMDTLNDSLTKEKDVHGLIIHSDQGFQYTSFSFDNASFKVSITNFKSFRLDITYEITCLSYKSIIVDKYALEPLNIKYVTSVSHTLFGLSVVKFLFNRFGLTLSSILSFLFFFFDFLTYSAIKLYFFIILNTFFLFITTPYFWSSPSTILRYPYVRLFSSNISLIIK